MQDGWTAGSGHPTLAVLPPDSSAMPRLPTPAAILLAAILPCLPAQAACDRVAADLDSMTSADQALRKRINHLEGKTPAQEKLMEHIRIVDRENTRRLKAIVAQCGWPTKAKYGEQAAGAAWLLAQHADHDLPVQRQALALIEQAAADSGQPLDQLFALLSDRVAVAEGRPQRYGTQLMAPAGKPCAYDFQPMDDRAKVEARRKAMRMPPLEDYRRIVLQMQHCPIDVVTGRPNDDYHYAPPIGAGR